MGPRPGMNARKNINAGSRRNALTPEIQNPKIARTNSIAAIKIVP